MSERKKAVHISPEVRQRIEFERRGRELRNLKKHLRNLTTCVSACLTNLDAEMRLPSSPERGNRIAAIANRLNVQNDIVRRFGLGEQ